MKIMTFSLVLCLAFTTAAFVSQVEENPKLPRHIKDRFALVPEGEVILETESSELKSFYMMRYEVSNLDYREYLAYLERQGNSDAIAIAQVHAERWKIPGAFMEPFAKSYHTHPAYDEYPVVNISRAAAESYCDWLTGTLNKIADGEYHVEVRLPTRAEWIRSARPIQIAADYTWGGNYLRNSKGQFQCNFKTLGPEQIHWNSEKSAYEVIEGAHHPGHETGNFAIARCASYPENAIGLYNMNGNVSEMVSDQDIAVGGSWNSTGYDVRIESSEVFDGPSPYVGFRPVMEITWE